ncbi:hypothetical protein OG455_00580 [Kitasatospora sp. NBC_01287]|uniref:hypothetical protein n=1 Tax=Kitasatospora sp. NBC_01287 TaxID=2903573 RepID=UPI0022577B4B|nr:hypothetical protein [Kitasatospora sp. NBC_01287]MCX4744021.1 hypothetical protein [Kitasatospora sp. NBC_01287]
MARKFIKTLESGVRVGNTRGLMQSQRDGWTLMGGPYQYVTYAPRAKNDPRPWTDGTFRYRALDCWAVAPTAPQIPAE